MNSILTIYYALPPQVWAFVLGTPAIVTFVGFCKKAFGTKSTLVIHSLTATISFLLVALPEYVLNNPKPLSWLGAYSAAFFAAANFLYALVKVLNPFFQEVKQYEDKKTVSALGDVQLSYSDGTVATTTVPVAHTVTTPGFTATNTLPEQPAVFEG